MQFLLKIGIWNAFWTWQVGLYNVNTCLTSSSFLLLYWYGPNDQYHNSVSMIERAESSTSVWADRHTQPINTQIKVNKAKPLGNTPLSTIHSINSAQ